MILLSLCEVSTFKISKGLCFALPLKNIENNHQKLESYQPSDLSLLSEEVCWRKLLSHHDTLNIDFSEKKVLIYSKKGENKQ